MRNLFCPAVALVLASLAVTGNAQAQPPLAEPAPTGLGAKSLDDLMAVEVETVFGASKHEQRVTEAPSAVTILTAEDIRLFGWRTMAEALSSVRGFYSTYDRNYTYLGVRGFGRPTDYNNRVLVLVNGHRFNDNVYDQALIGSEFPIDLALVERIEIIRGPGSALYGTSAFFAVINVVLRVGGAVAGTEAGFELGSFDTYRVRGTYGGRTAAGHEVLVSVAHMSSAGHDDLYFPEYDEAATGFGVSRGNDADASTTLFASASVGRLVVQGAFGTRAKEVPTGSWGTTFGDARNSTTDSRAWVDASVLGNWRGAAVSGRMFADYSGYEGTYIYEDGAVENRDMSRGVWVGGEGLASRRLGRRHRLATGAEYRANLRQDQKNWNVEPFAVLLDDRRRSNQIGLYVQDEIELHRRLTATIGARYDWWEQVGGTGRPRFALVYRTDADTAVKLLYGAAYRAPTVFEKYYALSEGFINETLSPEQVQTTEVVYEQYVGGRLRLTASGYFTSAANLISQGQGDELLLYRNGNETHSLGLELEAERRWAAGVLLRASYIAQRTREPGLHVDLSNSPRHLATFNAALPLLDRRLTAAVEGQFVGTRLTDAGGTTPSVWLTNVNVSFTPRGSRLTLAARISNAFDQAYVQPVGAEFRQDAVLQDGRTASLRATVRF